MCLDWQGLIAACCLLFCADDHQQGPASEADDSGAAGHAGGPLLLPHPGCRRNLATLIDSPGVLGPLPDPCSSPTFRKLSESDARCRLQPDVLPPAPSSAATATRGLSGRHKRDAQGRQPSALAVCSATAAAACRGWTRCLH